MHFHVIQYEMSKAFQTELQDLQSTFDIYLNEQLQTLPYIFSMNVSQIGFLKTKLDNHQVYFLTYFIVWF